jgi:hypothetical protein
MTAAVMRAVLSTWNILPPHISAARTEVMLRTRRIVRPSGIPSTVIM